MHQGVCGKMDILKERRINLFRVLIALVCALLCLTPGLESADAADVLPDAKYAVQVYGIEHDVDENEVPFGLTFGPALGGDFSIEGHQHAPSGTTIAGNAHRCIHTDSWADIIHWNYEDPYVYEQCVQEGCTQSVPIYLSSKIRGAANKYSALVPGDGAILYLEITDTMRAWNSASTTPGGWPASNIRAVFNGYDSYTASGAKARSQGVTEQYSLFAGFPSFLQDAIGAKKVLSCTSYSDLVTTTVTYDKLWAFSGAELGATKVGNTRLSTEEGTIYLKAQYNPLTETTNEYWRPKCVSVADGSSTGNRAVWLRSMSSSSSVRAANIRGDATVNVNTPFHYLNGYGPGFCLKKEDPTFSIAFQVTDGLISATSMANKAMYATVENFAPDSGFSVPQHVFDHWEDNYGNIYFAGDMIPANRYQTGETVIFTAYFTRTGGTAEITNGMFEFTLRDGETATFEDIPAGTAYQVWEETPDGWILVQQTDSSGNITSLETSSSKFINQYLSGATSVSIFGTVTLDYKPAEDDAFLFELWEDDGTGMPWMNSPTPIQTIRNGESGFIKFRTINYTDDDLNGDDSRVITYLIREIEEGNNDIIYDIHTEKVTVTLTSDGTNLSSSVSYWTNGQPDDSKHNAQFANFLKPGTLYVRKYPVGDSLSDAALDNQFTFIVTFRNKDGSLAEADSYTWYVQDAPPPGG